MVRRFGDPTVVVRHGAVDLRLPLSHELPYYVARFPLYDTPLPSLIRHLPLDGKLVVDVGANVGDTCARVRQVTDARIIAIEGEPGFVRLLRENVKGLPDIAVVDRYVGRPGDVRTIRAVADRGTAALQLSDAPDAARLVTLDEAIRTTAPDVPAGLIKIDTDGFELDVLLGAADVLERDQPLLFLEYDPPRLRTGGADAGAVRALLRHHGYSTAWLFDNIGNPMWSMALEDDTWFDRIDGFLERRHPDLYCDILVVPPELPTALGAHLAATFPP